MPSIQVDLNDKEDKTVQLTKVYNDLRSKEKAIKHIIQSYEEEKER